MNDDETIWPMDPSISPLIFRPQGYLVAILGDSEEGERAKATLTSAGYEPDDMRLYSGEEILANHELYNERRSVGDRIVGAVTDDTDGREMTSAMPARAGVRFGCVSRMNVMCLKRSVLWPSTTSFTVATTGTRDRTTSTSPDLPRRLRSGTTARSAHASSRQSC